MRALPSGATRLRVVVPALTLLLTLAGARALPSAAAARAAAGAAPLAAELARLRRDVPCAGPATEDDEQGLEHLGRPARAVSGRERAAGDGPAGPIRDFAIFDEGARRVVSYACFANASTRRAGEPIVSLAEISTRADARVLALLPGAPLALESIQRYRASGQDRVYYEARYAPTAGEPPFLEAPVRLLLNASTGALFRIDVDPDWVDPPRPARLMISRKAAERIARLVLSRPGVAEAFGPGATVAALGNAELYMVRPNEALGLATDPVDGRAQPAWVVPVRLTGAAAGQHALYVGASSGKILGGSGGAAAAPGGDAARPGDPR